MVLGLDTASFGSLAAGEKAPGFFFSAHEASLTSVTGTARQEIKVKTMGGALKLMPKSTSGKQMAVLDLDSAGARLAETQRRRAVVALGPGRSQGLHRTQSQQHPDLRLLASADHRRAATE